MELISLYDLRYPKIINKLQIKNKILYAVEGIVQDYGDTIDDYDKAIELKHDNPKFYYNRGVIYDVTKDYDGAITDYKKSFSLVNAPVSDKHIFYRFRPMNQNTLETLITNKFFVANPTSFNDPFDASLLRQDKNKNKNEPSQGLYQFNQNIRIACVAPKDSQDNCPLQNILLWSYYAENHTGIALGYKFNEKNLTEKKHF